MIDSRLIYDEVTAAFDYFNKTLFDNRLTPVAITLTRHRKAFGFFAPKAFRSREGEIAPEIALNPEHFVDRDPFEIYATLVHEMCHHYQNLFGKPSRNGYHNREFASIMKSVGLIASDTGEPGGKETGQNMSHYIDQAGMYIAAFNQFMQSHISEWGAMTELSFVPKGNRSKVKYTCPECEQNAWAKPGANLCCGDCSQDTMVFMVSEQLL